MFQPTTCILLIACTFHVIFAQRFHPKAAESRLKDGYKPRWRNARRMQRRLHAEPAGNTVKFQCGVEGEPMPSVTWQKDGQPIFRDGRLSGYRIRSNGQKIILESVVPADDGLYTCIARNKYGSINHTYELGVQVRAANRPVLELGFPSNKTATVGGDVTFRCVVWSDARPHIEWIRSVNRHDNPQVVVLKSAGPNTTDEEMKILLLKNVSFEDAGEYTCLAGNSIGISHQSAWLTVVEDLSPKQHESSPPIIDENNLRNTTVPVGYNVSFMCKVISGGNPYITWIRAQVIGSHARTVFLKQSTGYATSGESPLLLQNVSLEDAGEYTCIAGDSNGISHQSVWLQVERENNNEM